MELSKLKAIIEHRIALDDWHVGDGVDDCSGWDEETMKGSVDALAKTIMIELVKEDTEVRSAKNT